MAEVVSISSKGQIVIPKDLRDALGIKKGEKFLVVGERDAILLKRIKDRKLKKRMVELLDYFADKFSEAGVTEEDVGKEIAATRKR